MTRAAVALRIAMLSLEVAWWLPMLAVGFAAMECRRAAFNIRIVRVRRLRRAGRFDEASAALDRLRRDIVET